MRNLTWGIILVIIGLLLLLDNLDIVEFKDMIRDYWPLILILWGATILLRRGQSIPSLDSPKALDQTESEIIHQSEIFGNISLTITSQNFKGGSISTVFGDSYIDLSKATFADGEHELRVHGVFGDSIITLPKDAAVSVSGSSVFGDMTVLGQRKSGLSSNINIKTEHYDTVSKRLKITVSKVFGDLKIS